MSVTNLHSAGAASSVGKLASRDAAAANPKNSPTVAGPFSRIRTDGERLPQLQSACAHNGVIANYSFLEKAAVGDLMRVVRDVRQGDISKAKERLATMSNYDLGQFFKKNNIHPLLLGELSKAMDVSKDPKKVLAAVFGVLRNLGASELSSKLRPVNEARA